MGGIPTIRSLSKCLKVCFSGSLEAFTQGMLMFVTNLSLVLSLFSILVPALPLQAIAPVCRSKPLVFVYLPSWSLCKGAWVQCFSAYEKLAGQGTLQVTLQAGLQVTN